MKETSRHHLIPQKVGGLWIPDNIVRIDNRVHTAIHVLFKADTPIQQIRRILDFNEPVIQREVVNKFRNILWNYTGEYEKEAYKEHCFDETKFINNVNI